MVSLATAEKALKDIYLSPVANQLNTGVNPFLAKVQQTTADVWGKQIIKMVPARARKRACSPPRRATITSASRSI